MSRSAIAVLSTANLLHNLACIKNRVKPAKIIAMLKANAYGHGIRSVGLRLDGHVDFLGVASIDEALILRKAGVKAPIILMQGVYEPSELMLAAAEKFHVVFTHETQVSWLSDIKLTNPLYSWIKINTGMNRLGFDLKAGAEVYQHFQKHKFIHQPVRIMSHLGCADDPVHPLNQVQIGLFKDFIKDLDSEFSLCNSAGFLKFPDCVFDYVRPGLLLYGISPLEGVTAAQLGVLPVMTVQSKLMSVHQFKKGSFVGYGARYECPQDMPVGIVAFGYGDGYPLSAKDGTPLLVRGVECPLVGRVSMDMIAVDLRPCQSAEVGDRVTLWGEGLPIERVAKHTNSIVWELVASVQNRVKFFWSAFDEGS